jgi:hypothetical protein
MTPVLEGKNQLVQTKKIVLKGELQAPEMENQESG